jgi:selenide,water dikinase
MAARVMPLVLGKPLGVGILSAALKKGALDEDGYAQMIKHTTKLNRVGITLGGLAGVHAMTDVTGFGLAGHLLEICRGSGLDGHVALANLPLIAQAAQFAQEGIVTGASARNWAAYGESVQWPAEAPDWMQAMASDPQTSGGLLVSCAPDAVDEVLATFQREGFAQAAVVGSLAPAADAAAARLRFN